MKDDWAEVCDALGKPTIVCADEISYTKRNRAYWTNIDVPEDWRVGLSPRDPDTCMGPWRSWLRLAGELAADFIEQTSFGRSR